MKTSLAALGALAAALSMTAPVAAQDHHHGYHPSYRGGQHWQHRGYRNRGYQHGYGNRWQHHGHDQHGNH